MYLDHYVQARSFRPDGLASDAHSSGDRARSSTWYSSLARYVSQSPERHAAIRHRRLSTCSSYLMRNWATSPTYTSNCPTLPTIERNGWTSEDGKYVPVRCLTLPAPRAVIELTKCGCKSSRCSCTNNGLACTPLCKCYGDECENVIRTDVHEDEEEDEW